MKPISLNCRDTELDTKCGLAIVMAAQGHYENPMEAFEDIQQGKFIISKTLFGVFLSGPGINIKISDDDLAV